MSEELSFFKKNFWDLWLMKIFRNLASMKFQWLLLLYIPVVYGMFHFMPGGENVVWISPKLGLSLLGGGFVTLALGRVYARTKLTEDSGENLDTDR